MIQVQVQELVLFFQSLIMPKTIKAIIVEDDVQHQAELMEMLELSSFNIEILATCTNVNTASQAVLKYLPDLVFLDIELENRENGFDIIRSIENPKFGIILTTAAAQINRSDIQVADKICCIRHLFKPFTLEEVESKLLDFAENAKLNELKTAGLRKNMLEAINNKVICIGNKVVLIEDLLYIQSDGEICHFYLLEHTNTVTKLVANNRLGHYVKILELWNFIQSHKQFLVNLKHILNFYSNGHEGTLIVRGNKKIPISRERMPNIKRVIKK